jgi:hypothetical protein
MNKKVALLCLGLLLVVIILFHLVPIYSKKGEIYTSVIDCARISTYQTEDFRIIPNGFSGFDNMSRSIGPINSNQCGAEPINLRLYLW